LAISEGWVDMEGVSCDVLHILEML
jgi:hypothetical protein